MKRFIIIDWANNHVFKDEVFASEEDGLDFIFDNVESDEIGDFSVCETNKFKPTLLGVVDLLENKDYRTLL